MAALMVALAHAAVMAAGHGFAADDFGVPWDDLGVDLFFVISGFIIVCSSVAPFDRRARRIFLRRRFASVIPLHGVATSLHAVHLLVLEVAIQAAFRHGHLLPTAAYMALMLVLAIGAAFASYADVERPQTRRLQRLAGPPRHARTPGPSCPRGPV